MNNMDNLGNVLDDFINNDKDVKINDNSKKVVKTDNSIVERIDKIIITENGKQLLREVY